MPAAFMSRALLVGCLTFSLEMDSSLHVQTAMEISILILANVAGLNTPRFSTAYLPTGTWTPSTTIAGAVPRISLDIILNP
jgi:hypothetical protein